MCLSVCNIASIQYSLEKQEDDEIVLQIMYSFYRCLHFEETRKVLMAQKHIINAYVDLLQDKNLQICHVSDMCVDIVMAFDAEFRQVLRKKKWESYNAQWLKAMQEEEEEKVVPYAPTPLTLNDPDDLKTWTVDDD